MEQKQISNEKKKKEIIKRKKIKSQVKGKEINNRDGDEKSETTDFREKISGGEDRAWHFKSQNLKISWESPTHSKTKDVHVEDRQRRREDFVRKGQCEGDFLSRISRGHCWRPVQVKDAKESQSKRRGTRYEG